MCVCVCVCRYECVKKQNVRVMMGFLITHPIGKITLLKSVRIDNFPGLIREINFLQSIGIVSFDLIVGEFVHFQSVLERKCMG